MQKEKVGNELYWLRILRMISHKNGYHEDWKSEWVTKIQTKILLRMWGNRDALSGYPFEKNPNTGEIIERVNRHHYKYNKLECWLEVLVPLNDKSHGKTQAKDQRALEYKLFFEKAVEALMDADLDGLLKILEAYWEKPNIKAYEKWLKQQRFM